MEELQMAKRILIRKDTAQNWHDNNPMLYPGEFGVEIDTLKVKVGPLVNSPAVGTAWNSISTYLNVVPSDFDSILNGYVEVGDIGQAGGVVGLNNSKNAIIPGSSLIIEGPTNDSYETTLTVTDPTADRTITIPDIDGTLITDADTGTVTNTMLAGSIANNKLANNSVTINGYEIELGGSASYGTDNISEGTTNKYFTDERAQDAVAQALANGTHTNISVSYDDANNAISLTGAQTYNDEMARDAIGAALTGGTGITVTPNDNADTITVAVDNTIATKTYADNAVSTGISNLIASAPSALDTLNELAAALGNDANFSTTVTNALAGKQDKVTGVSDTEISYLDGVTSAIQTQLNAKASSTDLSNHENDTTNIHGIADTSALATKTYADNAASSAVSTHEADTTSVHGISDTSKLVTTDDSGTVTSTMIANGTIVNADINASAAIELSKLATDPLARANHTGTQLASTISDFDTQVRTSKITDLTAPTSSFSMNSQKITSLGTPTADADAATKAYVDAAVNNINVHEAVVAATTANINLNNGVENNDVLDGVTLSTGDRILVKNQNTASQNGIYIVAANGAPTRATDYNAAGEISAGDFIFVSGGTVNGSTGWIQTAVVTTVGTDSLSFTQFSGAGTYTASTGLSLSGTAFSIDSTVATLTGTQTLTNKTLTSPVLTTPTLGTPASATLTNATGLPISTGVSGLGTGIATFLGTPSSANLASAVTDETGSGALVFGTSPTISSPTITGTGTIAGTFTGNLTGNADTVTNGVYTSGSYSNPSWITALGWSKVTGTPTTVSGYGITNAVVTDAANTITAASASTKPLIIKGAASQTANLQEWQSSVGQSRIYVDSYGGLYSKTVTVISNDLNGSGTALIVLTKDAAGTPLAVKGWTSQTANLQEWQNSSGTVLALVDASGNFSAQDVTVAGNLTVNGTTTNLNSTNLVIEDKNIIIADVASPTNITADGGGITIKGSTDKTFNWVAANTAFTSSENMDLASGKTYKIAGTTVLSGSALGSGITSSSLTSVGTLTDLTVTNTITGSVSGNAGTVSNGVYTTGSYSNPSWITSLAASKVGLGSVENTALSTWAGSTNITTLGTIATGTWSGTTIATTKGGTGLTSYTTGDVLYASGTNTLAKLAAGTDGYLLTMSSGVPVWAAAPVSLPSQTGYSGYYLTTNGSSASWGQLPISQPSNTTISTNTANTVDTTALSGFTSAEYLVSLKQGSKVRTSKVILQTDGTSVDMTEFGITETGGTMTGVVVSATTVSTNAVLQVTVTDASSTNVTVKLSKITR